MKYLTLIGFLQFPDFQRLGWLSHQNGTFNIFKVRKPELALKSRDMTESIVTDIHGCKMVLHNVATHVENHYNI